MNKHSKALRLYTHTHTHTHTRVYLAEKLTSISKAFDVQKESYIITGKL